MWKLDVPDPPIGGFDAVASGWEAPASPPPR